ncbi:MAG: hypothetical protein OXF43_01035 [Gammaproteobacteria bacterium]|nr:hypothetical protein [Gammaproteobacteria bacterium]
MHTAQNFLAGIETGEALTCGGLSVFPLRHAPQSQAQPKVDYLLLKEAIEADLVSIREVSESGSVPELLVENRAGKPVLIIDGEELIGAKQNRIANLTLLVPAAKTTIIPVSCVEAGRWSRRSDEFALAERVQYAKGRAERLASVQDSMRRSGKRHSDQGRVWRNIAEKAANMDAESTTGAMSTIFEKHTRGLDRLVNQFRAIEGQVGAVFALGKRICGLDAFDKPATFATLLPKLVRSYGIDAIELGTIEAGAKNTAAPDAGTVDAFLEKLAKGEIEEHPAVGLGTDIRIEARGIIAGGLVAESSLLHIAVFVEPSQGRENAADNHRFASYNQRRRAYRSRRG